MHWNSTSCTTYQTPSICDCVRGGVVAVSHHARIALPALAECAALSMIKFAVAFTTFFSRLI